MFHTFVSQSIVMGSIPSWNNTEEFENGIKTFSALRLAKKGYLVEKSDEFACGVFLTGS